MQFTQVSIVVAALIGCAIATGGGYGANRGLGGGGYGGGAGANLPPQPYNFDYQARDEQGNVHYRNEQGNVHYRNEQGDQSGAVRGSYGYTDNQGLYRVVDYVADANGFRANIRTNEPGTDGKESPADVQLTAERPPAGIQDRYTRVGGGYVGRAGGYGGGTGAGGYGAGRGGASGFTGGAGRFDGAGGFGGFRGGHSGKSGY